MPSDHYQRVLEQDEQLPTPLRWLTRVMSSWWAIGGFGVLIVGYVAAAHVPLGGRYLWQWPLIDTTQQRMLNWWPLQLAALLLALVLVWSAVRRLPLRWASLGRFICVIGLATLLVSQSWAFRYQRMSVAAVPVAERDTAADQTPDPLALTYTTRAGDPAARELVVMIGGTQPVPVPVNGLPRWHDAAGDKLATMKLHDHARLAGLLDYRVRITPSAYLADGQLEETEDGKQAATPTPDAQRDFTGLPYPADALLALRFEVEPEDGEAATTTVWLPFEPRSTESLVPKRFYDIEGLGSVGLAFRPSATKLPFAMAASRPDVREKWAELNLYLADADREGRILQPAAIAFSSLGTTQTTFRATNEQGRTQNHLIDWVYQHQAGQDHAMLIVAQNTSNPFILAGLVTFLLGVALDVLPRWVGPKPKSGQEGLQ